MNTELIKAENISFKINENRLFHNLTFSLNKGEALQRFAPYLLDI